MDLFCHITEFGSEGMQSVPAMAILCERVVLWSPSAGFIDEAHARGQTGLTSRAVIELVEGYKLRLMGRESWFKDPGHRAEVEKRFPNAAWVPDYDLPLMAIAEEDKRFPIRDRRIIMAPPEPGKDHADEVMSAPHKRKHARALVTAEAILADGHLPLGLQQKLAPAEDHTARLRIVLRDVKNHKEALIGSGSNDVAIMADEANVYAAAVTPPNGLALPPEDLANLKDLIRLIRKIANLQGTLSLSKILAERDLAEYRMHSMGLLNSRLPIAQLIRDDIEAGTNHISWLNAVLGPKPELRALTIAGFIAAVISASLEGPPVVALASAIGLASNIGPPILGAATKMSLRPAEYNGWELPFILGYGTDTPTYRQIKQMLALLDEELRRWPR
jgi:hypothetical protein